MREIPRMDEDQGRGKYQRDKRFTIEGPEDGKFTAHASLRDGAHSMEAHVVVEEGTMAILQVKGVMNKIPHDVCSTSMDGLQSLVGMQIKPGIFSEMQKRVGGAKGCIHMNDLVRETLQLVAAHWSMTQLRRMMDAGRPEEEILDWGDAVRSWTCTATPGPLPQPARHDQQPG